MRLVLGTAQFGLDYGITNKKGKVAEQEVVKIIEHSAGNDINLIDTAIEYGNSETILGKYCSSIGRFEFISKIRIGSNNNLGIAKEIENSCRRLGVSGLYGLMVHDVDSLLSKNGDRYWGELIKLKQQGKINKIGVSVYSPEQAETILGGFKIDIIQIPLNLLDQRFIVSGLLKEFKRKNIEVHVRSIFLQGLLLSDYAAISSYFEPIKLQLNLIDKICRDNGISKLALVFAYLKTIRDIDALVFGVTRVQELDEVIAVFHSEVFGRAALDFDQLHVSDENMVNPVFWPKRGMLSASYFTN